MPVREWLLGDGLLPKIVRFALVGGLSTIVYGIVTLLAVEGARMPPLAATVFGYLLVVPLNYLLQRSFTFRSVDDARREIPRFLLVHGANIVASFLAMYAVTELLRLDYRWGVAATMLLVPVIVFLIMDRWVFRNTR